MADPPTRSCLPRSSLDFYQRILGMSLLATSEQSDFTLYFLAYAKEGETLEQMSEGRFGREGIVELVSRAGTTGGRRARPLTLRADRPLADAQPRNRVGPGLQGLRLGQQRPRPRPVSFLHHDCSQRTRAARDAASSSTDLLAYIHRFRAPRHFGR